MYISKQSSLKVNNQFFERIVKITMLMFFNLLILQSCNDFEDINSETTLKDDRPFTVESLKLSDEPEIQDFVFELITDRNHTKNKNYKKSVDNFSFNFDKIIKVVDTTNHQNYSLRFVYDSTPSNIFYNLIVSKNANNELKAYVEKYICENTKFENYKNTHFKFHNFYGTVELYDVRCFFSNSTSSSRIIESDPCPPKYYPNGDPMPTATSFIYAGSNASSSGGGGNTTTGGSNSSGSNLSGATWGAGLSVTISNGGSTSTGCCSCGRCDPHWYVDPKKHVQQRLANDPCPDLTPIGFIGIASEPTNLQLLRLDLQLSIEQWQFLHGKDVFMAQLVQALYSNPSRNTDLEIIAHWAINFAMNNHPREVSNILALSHIINNPTSNIDFVKQFVDNSINNPTLKLNFIDSVKSPANIDRSSITNITPEGTRFNEIYEKLTELTEFKNIFTDIFGGQQTRLNVKFVIEEHVYHENNPLNYEVAANITSFASNNNYLIRMNKQCLVQNGTLYENKLENAKTIVHEAIHAFLDNLYKNQNTTINNLDVKDIKDILNELKLANSNHHDIMFNKLTTTIQNILKSLKNSLTTQAQRDMVEDYLVKQSPTPPHNEILWNWDTYFEYLSYTGLHETAGFIEKFPSNSNAYYHFSQYITIGRIYLNM